METEEVQTALDDLREEALGLENDVQASLHARRKLQPQVDLCFPLRDNSSIRCREHSSILATSVSPLASLQQIFFTPLPGSSRSLRALENMRQMKMTRLARSARASSIRYGCPLRVRRGEKKTLPAAILFGPRRVTDAYSLKG